MNFKLKLDDLKKVATKLLIEIKYLRSDDTEFSIQSGFCRFKGKQLIVLENQIPECEQVNIILEVLSKFDLENIYLPPWIREQLEGSSSQQVPKQEIT